MEKTYRKLIVGALLHDIGKLVQRAMPGAGSHSSRGMDFASEFLDKGKWADTLECIGYHHAEEIKNAALPSDSLAYIVYEADNIAAGADRRKTQQGQSSPFERYTPLHSIFNRFRHAAGQKETAYPLNTLKEDLPVNFPQDSGSMQAPEANQAKYQQILNSLSHELKKIDFENDSLDSILKLMETHLAYVPSSTSTSELPDISLFNHLKLTASISGCFYGWFKSNNSSDYKEACFDKVGRLRDTDAFLLVSGDWSGIQDFIYTISSKGALKSLRGRSFYLEMLTEHIVDEILTEAGMSRANLLYSGGGHFYMLLPNTFEIQGLLKKAKETVNGWLIEKFGTNLYLELAWCQASANQLGNDLDKAMKTENKMGMLFRNVAKGLSKNKLQRYGINQIEMLMSPESSYNSIMNLEHECSICGTSRSRIVPLKPDDPESIAACQACRSLFYLGDKLPRLNDDNGRKLTVLSIKSPGEGAEGMDSIAMPSLKHGQVYLNFESMKAAEGALKSGENLRIYSINRHMTGLKYSTNLWAGLYCAENKETLGLIDFSTLAKRSKGIERLGVLRADVDNLGQAFVSGFEGQKGDPRQYQFVSLSRYASLSYNLSMFFKFEINKLCSGKAGIPQFRLDTGHNGISKPRELVIVYSGGDDVFVVGAWNEVLEFAVDLRTAFGLFTNGKMTMSAGFGLFDHKFPISQMARITGDLEKCAKNAPGKDSISLFGMDYESGSRKNNHTYAWDTFINRVCREKLTKFNHWLDFDENKRQGKLPCGKTFLYKLLKLYQRINDTNNPDGRLDLARLAYTLARMEPTGSAREALMPVYRDMRDTLYNWAFSPGDCRETITALYILIYLNRKENDPNG